MCNPAVAMAVVGGLQSGAQALGAQQQRKMQYQAAKQQAEMQRRYQEQAAAAERQRAQQEQSSMRMRQAQEQEAVGRELEQLSLRTRQAISRTKENPYAAALADDYIRQEGAVRTALLRQQELGAVATGLGLEQAGFASQQRLIGIRQPIAQPIKPRGLGIQDVLSVASGGLQGYMMGQQLSGGMGGSSGVTQSPVSGVSRGGTGGTYLDGGYKIL